MPLTAQAQSGTGNGCCLDSCPHMTTGCCCLLAQDKCKPNPCTASGSTCQLATTPAGYACTCPTACATCTACNGTSGACSPQAASSACGAGRFCDGKGACISVPAPTTPMLTRAFGNPAVAVQWSYDVTSPAFTLVASWVVVIQERDLSGGASGAWRPSPGGAFTAPKPPSKNAVSWRLNTTFVPLWVPAGSAMSITAGRQYQAEIYAVLGGGQTSESAFTNAASFGPKTTIHTGSVTLHNVGGRLVVRWNMDNSLVLNVFQWRMQSLLQNALNFGSPNWSNRNWLLDGTPVSPNTVAASRSVGGGLTYYEVNTGQSVVPSAKYRISFVAVLTNTLLSSTWPFTEIEGQALTAR
jgi:hypothetical protein